MFLKSLFFVYIFLSIFFLFFPFIYLMSIFYSNKFISVKLTKSMFCIKSILYLAVSGPRCGVTLPVIDRVAIIP